MFAKLSGIQWKGAVRSTMWARNVAANIFIGIGLLLLALNLISIGLFIDLIFEKAAPGIDPVKIVNSYLLYYFIVDIVARLILQKKHGIKVKPLLLLPLSRNSLVHYILVKSFYSIFNFIPLLVIIPFTIKVVVLNYGAAESLAWIFFFIFLVLGNSFIATYVKKAATASYKYAVIFSLTGIGIFLLDKFKIISFSKISSAIFSLPLENPAYVLLPIIALAAIYNLNFGFLKSKLYMDTMLPPVSRRTGSSALLQKIAEKGETGKFIALELKLLMRNKRSRSTVYLSISMIFFGLIFYPGYTRDERIPEPLAEHEQFIAKYEQDTAGQPDAKEVTFKVTPKAVPEDATLFIAGNHAVLRNWKAVRLPTGLFRKIMTLLC